MNESSATRELAPVHEANMTVKRHRLLHVGTLTRKGLVRHVGLFLPTEQ